MASSLLNRFAGRAARPRLVEALRAQQMLLGNEEIANKLADCVELIHVEADQEIIVQDTPDTDLFFILHGEFSIRVNGRQVATREAGQHVGEMALIDTAAKRSASVVAIHQSIVAKISESIFSSLATVYPSLWRRLALELGNRLRERNTLVPKKREQPTLFLGSSAEALDIAEEIQRGLKHAPFPVRLWSKGVFTASRATIEDLENQLAQVDFAALLLSADDKVTSRTVEHDAPRDNIIFELGLFMGALRRDRTFFIKPKGLDIKIPSDLFGINPIEYYPGSPDTLGDRLGPVCTELRNLILKRGPR